MESKSIYILGIGGSGMSSIGKYLKQKGFDVIGYDQRKSYVTNLLNQDGIDVVFSEKEIPYKKNALYIYSSAINIDDKDKPINAAKIQKTVCAFEALIFAIPKLI